MDDEEYRRLVAGYLDTANPDMAQVVLELAAKHDGFGIDHALREHGVAEQDVREVLFEHPAPERKRSTHDRTPPRTLYWGANRKGREVTVAVIEHNEGGRLHLTLITAFPETEQQWRTRR